MNDLIRQVHAKYSAHVAHATQVAHLATRLFAELGEVHGLQDADRDLLTQAAYLHDIGHFVHKKKHHKHSHHLILHDRLLDEWEAEFREHVALLALNHRKNKLLQISDLPKPLRGRFLSLTALLRIADVLDYEHEQTTTVEKVVIDHEKKEILLSVTGMPLLPYEQKLRDKLHLAARVWNMGITVQNGQERVSAEESDRTPTDS